MSQRRGWEVLWGGPTPNPRSLKTVAPREAKSRKLAFGTHRCFVVGRADDRD